MKALASLLIILGLASCCGDENYTSHRLRIYLEDTHRYTPATFETVTEQFLLKEAHHEGATFETVTEQVLSKEGYIIYNISSRNDISIVTNAETFRIQEIPCIYFYQEQDYEEVEVPDIYISRSYQRVDQDGTGPFIDASYNIHEYLKVDEEADLTSISSDERLFQDFEFMVSEEMEIDSFIRDQLEQQDITDCLKEESYEIR